MSNIYIQEPPTHGKILLKTTVGDIDIELWSREAPKACRNFIQLCLEGYYNGTIFHRVVKGFIVQGGDPTGTGTGGESIYGEPFKDEFHSRLRFIRRGLLAMANAEKNDNGSQFFFTMGPAPELQNKHTIFAKVTGETVFNMLKLEEGLVDHDDRPLYPHKIIKTEVLMNPFPDIVPRVLPKKKEEKQKKKEKKSGVKNFKLLSFGEEAEEDEEESAEANRQFSGKSKSTHDVLNDPKLSSVTAVDVDSSEKPKSASEGEESDLSGDEAVGPNTTGTGLESIRKKLKKDHSSATDVEQHKANKEEDSDEDYYFGKEREEEKKRKAEQLRKEIRDLKRDMLQEKQKKDEMKKEEEEEEKKNEQISETLKEYKAEQEKYKALKMQLPKKGSSREDFTMSLLAKFHKKLASAKEAGESSETPEESKDDDDFNDGSWLGHKLQFESKTPVLAKDASTKNDDWFEIYDPRNPINKRRREDSKAKIKN